MSSSPKIYLIIALTPIHVKHAIEILNYYRVKKENINWAILFKSEKNLSLNGEIILNHDLEPVSIRHRKSIMKTITSLTPLKNKLNRIDVLITGNDHHIAFQFIYGYILNHLPYVISVDEGIGHYVGRSYKEYLKKPIYYIWIYMITGYKFSYISPLGSHKSIREIFLRVPNLRKFNNTKAIYKSFNSNNHCDKISRPNNSILILGFPTTEFSDLKHSLLLELTKRFNENLVYKPHPREDLNNDLRFEMLLAKTIAFEEINLHNYIGIIFFQSSVIIDLIQREYDKNHILNIRYKNMRCDFLFNDITTYKIQENEKIAQWIQKLI